MAQTQNFGDTISNGIQDIAALLPLLGTEQCERHVGEALQKGYLYAAATPLSIFGSLGVVKTAFATFLATMTKPFYGGSWLDDAGFITTGSVASMVTLTPGTKRYGAEIQLERLMKEQHIDNPEMISGIEWFGWRKAGATGIGFSRPNISWNFCLVLTSALASTFALTPYVYLALHNQGNALAWLFPLLRSFGSFLCVVSVQLALQLRIHHITSSSLLLMKARYRHPLSIGESIQEQDMLLESRLMTLASEAAEQRTLDLEKGSAAEKQPHGYEADITTPLSVSLTLAIVQISLVVGMGMIVAGYVGCFNLVSQTRAENGPYVWFGVEAVLSILRVILWGSNPLWDEKNTGIVLQFELLNQSQPYAQDAETKDSTESPFGLDSTSEPSSTLTSQSQEPVAAIPAFPLVTSPHALHRLLEDSPRKYRGQDTGRESFIAHNAEDFLAAASLYVGPLRRIEADGVSICYAILAEVSLESSQKLLCATVMPQGAGLDSISFLLSGGKAWHCAFRSHSRHLTHSRGFEVTLDQQLDIAEAMAALDSKTLDRIIEYSNALLRQLIAQDAPRDLHMSWSLIPSSMIASTAANICVPLSPLDQEYMRIGQLCDLKGDHCLMRGNEAGGLFPTASLPSRMVRKFAEYVLMFDSAMQEIYLCIMEQRFVERAGFPYPISHFLALAWVQKMEARLSSEREAVLERTGSDGNTREYSESWESLWSGIRSLRLLPANSPLLRRWEELLTPVIKGCPDNFLPLHRLNELTPFTGVDHLLGGLVSLFRTHLHTYPELVCSVGSSIERLHSRPSPPRFGRIDPAGPGSPFFSPPYTCISSPGTAEAFPAQIHLVKILALCHGSHPAWETVFGILCSLELLPPTLTTLVLSNYRLTLDMASDLLTLLKEKQTIIFVVFDRCYSRDLAAPVELKELMLELKPVITSNQQAWRRNASALATLHYSFGLDYAFDWKEQQAEAEDLLLPGKTSFLPQGHDILVQSPVTIAAQVWIPRRGRIRPVLSASPVSPDGVTLTAHLLRYPHPSSTRPRQIGRGKQRIAEPSKEFDVLQFDDFPEVTSGCYALHIEALECKQFAFRDLIIEFIPTDEDLDGVHPNSGSVSGGGRATEQSRSGTVPGRHPLPDTAKTEKVTEQDTHLSEHQDSAEMPSVTSDGPGSEVLETNGKLILQSVPTPVYRFQFSLYGPEGLQHGSFIFSPETTRHNDLNNLTMFLFPLTRKLSLERYWIDLNPEHVALGLGDRMAQERIIGASSNISGFFDEPGSGEQEEQPQGLRPGAGPEVTQGDAIPYLHPDSLEVTYLRDGAGHNHSEQLETQEPLTRQPVSPPLYRFEFSLHTPKGWHHGSFPLSHKIDRDLRMCRLKMVLFPHPQEIRLECHHCGPNSGRDATVREEEIARGHMAPASKGTNGPFNLSGLGDQEEPQYPGGSLFETVEFSSQEEDDTQVSPSSLPNESESHPTDRHSASCQ
ncbi:hypothetical protein AAF712_006200 [Marasmius tenuissimus]|uniref:Uncharacterized protein n=1 Tax=Marasmius tenuissimus TaxID=585030 RepID=A0ABR2ZYI9_9AGAR